MSKTSFTIKKVLGFGVCAATIAALFGYLVMFLWNSILVEVTPVKAINFWQSLGLLLLSKILFGGFNKGFAGKGSKWSSELKAKWHNMNDEQKEAFKQQWRNKCNAFSKKHESAQTTINEL